MERSLGFIEDCEVEQIIRFLAADSEKIFEAV